MYPSCYKLTAIMICIDPIYVFYFLYTYTYFYVLFMDTYEDPSATTFFSVNIRL